MAVGGCRLYQGAVLVVTFSPHHWFHNHAFHVSLGHCVLRIVSTRTAKFPFVSNFQRIDNDLFGPQAVASVSPYCRHKRQPTLRRSTRCRLQRPKRFPSVAIRLSRRGPEAHLFQRHPEFPPSPGPCQCSAAR